MIAPYIFQEHIGHLWSMVGTGLSIFKLYISTIPALSSIINLECFLLSKVSHCPSVQNKEMPVAEWPELQSYAQGSGKCMPLNSYVCMLTHLHVIFKQTSFHWKWTQKVFYFIFFISERQLKRKLLSRK